MSLISFRVYDKLRRWYITDPRTLKEAAKIALNLGSDTCIDPNDLVLQWYTGLTDSNGKPIYEGDIIMWENDFYENPNYRSIVTYVNGGFLADADDCGTHLGLIAANCTIVGSTIYSHLVL